MTLRAALEIDAESACAEIEDAIRDVVADLGLRGAVIGISGGVDSAVCAALCARALGPERVLGLLMPERDAPADSLRLGLDVARRLRVSAVVEEVGPALSAMGCYERQREAIRVAFPAYGPGWRCRLLLPSLLEGERLSVFRLEVESPGGDRYRARLTAAAYKKLVAATNFKQRTRKAMEYYHADRLGYAVTGTPNRLEFDQGFFVKLGDGAADVKPIAHLYKTQVYALADYLGVPPAVTARPPTTDTFSIPQTQEEFYFALPYELMDLCLYGVDHGVPAARVAEGAGLTTAQVERVYRDIEAKRRAARYLHAQPHTFAPDAPAARSESPGRAEWAAPGWVGQSAEH